MQGIGSIPSTEKDLKEQTTSKNNKKGTQRKTSRREEITKSRTELDTAGHIYNLGRWKEEDEEFDGSLDYIKTA